LAKAPSALPLTIGTAAKNASSPNMKEEVFVAQPEPELNTLFVP
jgi:hypothetical protein